MSSQKKTANPSSTAGGLLRTDPSAFPIVEIFGHKWDSISLEMQAATQRKWCPFANVACEKYRQYHFGYCSVRYAAAGDSHDAQIYAVCDHRLDGPPLRHVVIDHFGTSETTIVPEIVLNNPRTSFDSPAISKSDRNFLRERIAFNVANSLILLAASDEPRLSPYPTLSEDLSDNVQVPSSDDARIMGSRRGSRIYRLRTVFWSGCPKNR